MDKGEVKETRPVSGIERPIVGPTKASRPAYSMLILITEPEDAEVFINGKSFGKATGGQLSKEMPSRKTYKIKVTAGEDYNIVEKQVTLKPRGYEVVKAPLTFKYGVVKIFPAKEGVTIFLDGKVVPPGIIAEDKENGILTINKIPPGQHKIVYDLPGYVIYERSFDISPGSVYSWNFQLEPAVVSMTLETDPDTAVYVDDSWVGKTASNGVLNLNEIKLGEHEIKLVKDSFEEYKTLLKFEYQKPVRLTRRLVPLPNSTEFRENFDVPNQKWTTPGSGVTVTSGRLNLENVSSLAYPTGINYRDFEMTFHLKMGNAGGAAWALRAKDSNNYYLFYLSGPEGAFKNSFLTYVVRDNRVDLNNPVDSVPVVALLKPGGQYQIFITAKGNRIEHTVIPTDTGIAEKFGVFDDPQNTYQYGGVGFRTIRYERFSIDELFINPVIR